MEEIKQISSLIKLFVISTLMLATILTPFKELKAGQITRFTYVWKNDLETAKSLPVDLSVALSLEHGNYEWLVDANDFLNDLETADIILIGEAHHDQRDMQTAFEITRLIAKRRKIALAVERFPLSLQPSLSNLDKVKDPDLREAALREIFQSAEYTTVWKPDSFNSGYLATPSTDQFEAMVVWAVQNQIPIIGLDLPLSERKFGYGENIPYRNEVWKRQIVNFLENNQAKDYMVIAVGGIDHFSNARDSVQEKIKNHPSNYKLLSIGQRDANYSTKLSFQIENLALSHKTYDLIIQNPEFAVVQHDGIPIFPTPPDYWISVHLVDSWESN